MKTMIKKFLLLVAMVGLSSSISGRAIHRAVLKGDLEKVKKILQRYPERLEQRPLGVRDDDLMADDTPLVLAARQRKPQIKVIKFLLQSGASTRNIKLSDSRHPSVAILLVQHGVPFTARDLSSAIYSSVDPRADKSIVRKWTAFAVLLIERGVDILAGGKYSPLRTLFPVGRHQGWNVRIMQAMLDKDREKVFSMPVFNWANKMNKQRRLQAYKLFVAGDLHRKYQWEKTALHSAAASGDVGLARYLIENGGGDDLDERDAFGKRPIDYAKAWDMHMFLKGEMQKRSIAVEQYVGMETPHS